ncbi:Cloroperoxidase [Apiospora kogelbergensis]|uniref:Cloroperoxidase n=1 Tax=Apiospora kogelbergensis TaxID=1337665 RepID=UPI00313049D1
MKLTYISVALAVTPALALLADDDHEWRAPVEGQVRGPCPMLNTLANHGFMPRDGKNINKKMAIDVLNKALNWDETAVNDLYDFAQPTNPAPNATSFDLNHLTTHNILEHDGSLSRMDSRFGPADVFDEATWNETMQYFTGSTIDLAKASRARTARVVASASTNPDFTLPQVGANFIYGESAAFQFVFGEWDLNATDPKNMVHTPTDLVEYFFRNERLPYELGWKRPVNRLSLALLTKLVMAMKDITIKQMGGEDA